MVFSCKLLKSERAGVKPCLCLCFMNQNVTSVTGFDCSISWVCITGYYYTTIFRIEAIAIAFHSMLCFEGCYSNVAILINDPGCDFMCIHFVSIRKITLVSFRIG